jgi:uncharacterized protein (TIGR02246 family)
MKASKEVLSPWRPYNRPGFQLLYEPQKRRRKRMAISNEIRDGVASTNASFMATFSRGDAAGMAELYTENGQLMPPNSDFVTGKPAIQAVWQSVMDMGIKDAKLETVELEGQGDTAVEVGVYTLSGEGGQLMDRGKFIVVWKEEGGQWKLHRDIWNSSLPAP